MESCPEQLQIRRKPQRSFRTRGRTLPQITEYAPARSEVKEKFEEMDGKRVSAAGRTISKRGWARPCSAVFRTEGRIQLYVRIDELGEEAFACFKKDRTSATSWALRARRLPDQCAARSPLKAAHRSPSCPSPSFPCRRSSTG